MQLEYIPPQLSKDAKSDNAEVDDMEREEGDGELGIESGALGSVTTLTIYRYTFFRGDRVLEIILFFVQERIQETERKGKI